MSMDDVKLLTFPQHGDSRGQMSVIEGERNIPFAIKRIFYIYGTDTSAIRGQHANRKSEFVMINVSGSSKVRVRDGHGQERIFTLDQPNIGLYLPRMTWKDMYDFSEDAVLLVLSSELYDADEYIRDYQVFEHSVALQSGIGEK